MLGRDGRSTRSGVSLAADGAAIDRTEVPDCFNNYFVTVATSLASSLPNTGDYHNPLPRCPNSCIFEPVTRNEIRETVLSFNSKKCHKDEIPIYLIKRILDHILAPLVHIINLAIVSGIYPDCLKQARVVAIHKSGDPKLVSNYRPISTLNVFNKILEKVIHHRLLTFLDDNATLTEAQFGFRKHCSTTTPLFWLVQDLLKTYHSKLYTICLFLDLKKAFDTVVHKILLSKLESYGIRGTANNLIKSYLENRHQYVEVNGLKSADKPVSVGVPQGSVLGSVLFNLFINNMVNIPNVKLLLFADDAVCYVTGNSVDEAVSAMRLFIARLSDWLSTNRLIAHENKTKLMLITCRPIRDVPDICFNNVVLDWVSSFKYLGVQIDRNLFFRPQVYEVCMRLSKAVGMMYCVSKFLPQDVLLTIYYTLCYPHIIQSIVIWGGAPVCQISRIQILMNKILRLILNIRNDNNIPTAPTTQMYCQLRLLKFPDIHKYFLIKFYRHSLQFQPLLYNTFFRPLIPAHPYRTRNDVLNYPKVRLDVERRGTVFQCAHAFRSIPRVVCRACK